MAFWNRIILKHVKYWYNGRLPMANQSMHIYGRYLCTQVMDSGALVQEAGLTQEGRSSENEAKTFEELFRKSTFVALGNPKGKIVIGTIKKIVERSVYIDFGWKFPCVCTLPTKGSGRYFPGKKVRIMIKELEMASKFLGSQTELSLNEADCVLLGLHSYDSSRKDGHDARLIDEEVLLVSSDKSQSSIDERNDPLNIGEVFLSLKEDSNLSQETSKVNKEKPTPVDPTKSDS